MHQTFGEPKKWAYNMCISWRSAPQCPCQFLENLSDSATWPPRCHRRRQAAPTPRGSNRLRWPPHGQCQPVRAEIRTKKKGQVTGQVTQRRAFVHVWNCVCTIYRTVSETSDAVILCGLHRCWRAVRCHEGLRTGPRVESVAIMSGSAAGRVTSEHFWQNLNLSNLFPHIDVWGFCF